VRQRFARQQQSCNLRQFECRWQRRVIEWSKWQLHFGPAFARFAQMKWSAAPPVITP